MSPGEGNTVRITMHIEEARAFVSGSRSASDLIETIAQAVRRADDDLTAAIAIFTDAIHNNKANSK
jgi:hypothetical protein